MGGAKTAWLEAQEREWDAPEKHVCTNCVSDPYLQKLIETQVESPKCDYCGSVGDAYIAAPVEVLMLAVVGALNCYFAEPAGAGVPYESAEGGFLVEPMDTAEALFELDLECHSELFEDIANAISNDSWVEAADGHWASEHMDRLLKSGWERFTFHVKHRQRYFFSTAEPEFGQDIEPSQLMPAVADAISQLELMAGIPANYDLYRVRTRSRNDAWPLDAKHLGAPPSGKTTAGRMNPPGISYMYLALKESTAVAEVARNPPCSFAIGHFQTTRHISVLDLTDLPILTSKFDYEKSKYRERLLFLTDFVEAISRPVEKDGSEHIEYVPSQIVCEYFASVFQHNGPLDGILYSSAVQPGGKNLVLFPRYEDDDDHFPQVVFREVRLDSSPDWTELIKLIS